MHSKVRDKRKRTQHCFHPVYLQVHFIRKFKVRSTFIPVPKCHTVKWYIGHGGKSLYGLNLGTRYSCIFTLMLQQVYSWGKNLQYLLKRRLGGLQSQSEHGGKEKNPIPARNQTLVVQPLGSHFTD
jgi:hypothetical protein